MNALFLMLILAIIFSCHCLHELGVYNAYEWTYGSAHLIFKTVLSVHYLLMHIRSGNKREPGHDGCYGYAPVN